MPIDTGSPLAFEICQTSQTCFLRLSHFDLSHLVSACLPLAMSFPNAMSQVDEVWLLLKSDRRCVYKYRRFRSCVLLHLSTATLHTV